ncbi:hypothetical protein V8F06_013493 [Rhypophila decipiens]
MPRQKKGPTDEEWGLQKSRIKEIFDRKGNDGDKVTVAKLREIMKRDHSFDAPLWQYEAKLKEWNLKRNGRLEDWAIVISKVDQLGEGGMIVRVLMSGHAVEKKIINRNRRLVNKLKAAGKQLCPFDEWRADPRTDYISIEVQNQADEWVSYTGDQCLEEVTRPLVAPRSGLATFDSRDIAPSLNVETNIRSPISLRFNPPQLSPSMVFGDAVLPMLPQIPDSPFSQLIQYPPDTSAGPWSHQNDVTFVQSSTQQSVVRYQPAPRIEIPATPFHISYQFDPVTSDETQQPAQNNGFGIIQFIPRPVSPWSDSLRRLIQSVLRDRLASQTSVARVVKIPQVEDVLDGLESQISLARDVSRTISTTDIGAEINSKLQHSIYLSIINGLASFPVPSVIIGVLLAKTQSTVGKRMLEHLQIQPLAMAKHLASNLFRAAVETGDAQSLSYIIDVMRSRGVTINPHDIFCQHLDGREESGMFDTFTCVELADHLENAEVLNILSTKGLKSDFRGLLYSTANPSIAFTLLRNGAHVDPWLANNILKNLGQVDERLVSELLKRLQDIHCEPNDCANALCGSEMLLLNILSRCEVTFAVASIRRLLENGCIGWAATLIEILSQAPEEAGRQLCEFATTTVLHILESCERSRGSVISLSRLVNVLAKFLRSLSARDTALSYEFAMTAIDRFIKDCKTYGYPNGFPLSILISLVNIPTDAALTANHPICNFAMSTVCRLVEDYNSFEDPNYRIQESFQDDPMPKNPTDALAECLCAAAGRADVLVCKFLLDFIPMSHHALITAASANRNNPVIDLFLDDERISEVLQEEPSPCSTHHKDWQDGLTGCTISTRTALGDAVRRRDIDLVARLEKAGAWRLVQHDYKAFKDVFFAAIETDPSDFLSRLLKIWNNRLPRWSTSHPDDILHIIYISIEKDMTDIALSLLDAANQMKHCKKEGGFLLHLALARGNERIVEVLLESDMSRAS